MRRSWFNTEMPSAVLLSGQDLNECLIKLESALDSE